MKGRDKGQAMSAMGRYVLLALGVVFLSGCLDLGPSWSDKDETRQVDYYKEQCDQNSPDLCFRIRKSSSDAWGVVEESFSGFGDYVWGQRHTVDVTVAFHDNGSVRDYQVTNLNSSTDITDSEKTFAINLYTDTGILVKNNDTNWQLGGEIAFDCRTACDALSTAVSNQYATRLEFNVTDSGIELNQLICASAESDFSSDCEGESKTSWRVGWFQSDCGLADSALCLVYKVNNSDDYELLQLEEGISGFTPEWGNRYDMDVTVTVSNGGNVTAVRLDEGDSNPDARQGSSYPFKMIVRGSALEQSDGGLVDLYDTTLMLNCSGFCSTLDGYIDNDDWLLLETYVDGDQLRLNSIECNDDSLADFRQCVDDEKDVTWEI